MEKSDLELMQEAYQALGNIHSKWIGRNTDKGQQLLTALRDRISEQTGVPAEAVQDNIRHEQ